MPNPAESLIFASAASQRIVFLGRESGQPHEQRHPAHGSTLQLLKLQNFAMAARGHVYALFSIFDCRGYFTCSDLRRQGLHVFGLILSQDWIHPAQEYHSSVVRCCVSGLPRRDADNSRKGRSNHREGREQGRITLSTLHVFFPRPLFAC